MNLSGTSPVNPLLRSRVKVNHKPAVKKGGIKLDNIVVIIGIDCGYNTPASGERFTVKATIKTDLKDCLKNVLAGSVKLVKEEDTAAVRIARPPIRLEEGGTLIGYIKEGQTLDITDFTLRKSNVEEVDTLLCGSLLDNRGLTDAVLCTEHDGLIDGHIAEDALGEIGVHIILLQLETMIEC
jgi:hypothetical protein